MEDKKNFYIDGQWVSPLEPRTFEVINPANEEPCAEISLGGKKDVDAAVGAARKAFGSWSFTSKNERLNLLEIWTRSDTISNSLSGYWLEKSKFLFLNTSMIVS